MQDLGPDSAPFRRTRPPGGRLERFVFERQLGAGGMGTVYGAFDRLLGRRVAVKLPRGGAGPLPWRVRARVLREAQALARVRHPCVVERLDVHLDADLACLVMGLFDGTSPRGRALGWRRVAAIGAQIGDALAAVHRAGLVHRDVSPDNILVGAGDRACLIDFGLARAIGPASGHDDDFLELGLSPPAVAAGTPAFMAPEQRRGDPPAPEADQYALCATLRALLGDAARAGDAAPGGLARALERGLSEEPHRRFPDMVALAGALRDVGAR